MRRGHAVIGSLCSGDTPPIMHEIGKETGTQESLVSLLITREWHQVCNGFADVPHNWEEIT